MSTDAETAWLAGVIDAGGSIRIAKARAYRGRETYFAVVALRSRSAALLDRVLAVAGCGAVALEREAVPGRNAYLRWAVESADAAALLAHLRPLLIAQAEVADAALAVQTLNDANHGKAGRSVAATASLAVHHAIATGRADRRRILLTPAQVRAIRRAWKHDPRPTLKSLADEHGIAVPTVSGIVNRRSWRDLPDEEDV